MEDNVQEAYGLGPRDGLKKWKKELERIDQFAGIFKEVCMNGMRRHKITETLWLKNA